MKRVGGEHPARYSSRDGSARHTSPRRSAHMFRLFAGGFVLAALALTSGGPVAADDKKDPKEKLTAWVRKVDCVELKFEMGKETAKFHVTAGANGVVATAKLKIEKDTVTAEVTDV